MSRKCFVFCSDNVATEVPLSRPRRLRQEVRVATRRLVKAKGFRVATEHYSVATGFHGVLSRRGILCRDTAFYVVTELARPGVFML